MSGMAWMRSRHARPAWHTFRRRWLGRRAASA
jgi:hypothetical protein